MLKYLTLPEGWVYRGEGNSNLVISLPNTGKVLHIRKGKRKGVLMKWINECFYYVIHIIWFLCIWIFKLNIFRESRNIRFYNSIMRSLIGEEYVSEAREVILTQYQVALLERKLENLRPGFRKHKVLMPGRATILDDFAFVPDNISHLGMVDDDSFAVEIKPKQGWIPLSMKLFPKCVYCMNQYLKLEKGNIQCISSYCPEDFFSGNELSLIKSIKALIENPQNNFRIFKNGNLVYDQECTLLDFAQIVKDMFDNSEEKWASLKESFCYLIKEGLTRKLSNQQSSTRSCSAKAFCEWDTSMRKKYKHVFKGCVVERILSVQMFDVEGSSYYNSLLDPKSLNCGTAYVEKLLQEINKFDKDICTRCALMLIGNVNQSTKTKIDLRGIPYWISSIANDCSLMLAFRKVKTHDNNDGLPENLISSKYGTFAVRIGVFDLFPKNADIIKRHVKRNEEIFKAYVENLSLPQRNSLIGSSEYNDICSRTQFSATNSNSILHRVKNIFRSMF